MPSKKPTQTWAKYSEVLLHLTLDDIPIPEDDLERAGKAVERHKYGYSLPEKKEEKPAPQK